MSHPSIDSALAQSLVCASIQTYTAYGVGDQFPGTDPLKIIGNPKGLSYIDWFRGQDDFDTNEPKLVLFGLIFASTDHPGTYAFAFRGTEGIHEWIDDAEVAHTTFKPHQPENGPPVPHGAHIEDGFWKIYQSMQSSLFDKLSALDPKPTRLLITGHSLGSSLAELFTADVAISVRDLAFTSYNFACPRVGNEKWASFYNSATQAKGGATIRFVNTKDIVPRLPPRALGFRHSGEAYDICFESTKGFLPDYGLRHSANNYARTLAHQFGNSVDCQLSGKEDDLRYC